MSVMCWVCCLACPAQGGLSEHYTLMCLPLESSLFSLIHCCFPAPRTRLSTWRDSVHIWWTCKPQTNSCRWSEGGLGVGENFSWWYCFNAERTSWGPQLRRVDLQILAFAGMPGIAKPNPGQGLRELLKAGPREGCSLQEHFQVF